MISSPDLILIYIQGFYENILNHFFHNYSTIRWMWWSLCDGPKVITLTEWIHQSTSFVKQSLVHETFEIWSH